MPGKILDPSDPLVQQMAQANAQQQQMQSKFNDLDTAVFAACYAQFAGFELTIAYADAKQKSDMLGQEELGEFQVNFGRAFATARQATLMAMTGLGFVKPAVNGKPQ